MLQFLHYPKRILTFLLNKNTVLEEKEQSVTECNGFISRCRNMAENRGFPQKKTAFYVESCLCLLFLRLCGGNDLFHIFFKFHTGQHDHMSASAAFDAEINARPQDFPLVGATGMVFFHLYDIANRKLHGLSLLLLYDMQGALREGDFDAFFVQPV